MFRKKRSSSSINQSRPQSANPSATTAAAQAFLSKQGDEHGLSNAAAAAALRSYTPTPVGETQTKRMIRRGSTSSIGSSASNQRQPFSSNLQRRGSNGSMSSRTFRSPSPGSRNATPPVPKLPKDVPPLPNNGAPAIPTRSAKRSIDNSPRMTPRTMSPQQDNRQQRPKSMESSRWAQSKQQAPVEPMPNRASGAVSPTSPGSPRNINFSRPMSPLMTSPTPGNIRNSTASPPPVAAASLGLTPEQYRRLEERREAARLQELDWIERERNRNDAQRLAREGAQAKAASRPFSSAGPARPAPDYSALPMPKRGQAPAASPGRNRPVSMPVAASPPPPGNRVSSAPSQRPRVDTQITGQTNSKQAAPASAPAPDQIPSPSAEQIKLFQTRAASLLARPLTDNFTAPTKPLPKSATTNSFITVDPAKQHNRSVSSPVSSPAPTPQRSLTVGAGRGRETSASPARSAHFSDSPLLSSTKHAPPPRSVSPVKSALKGSSPRTVSPLASRDHPASDIESVLSDEGSQPNSAKKKKSVRVSFEERPMMVGQAAGAQGSPVDVMSPQYKKKANVEDQDFSMTPRPVLPSFGSVRGKKNVQGDDMAQEEPQKEELRPLRGIGQALRDEDTDDDDALPASRDGQPAPSNLAAPEIAVQPATPRFEEGDSFAQQQQVTSKQPVAHDFEGALSADDAPSAAESQPKPVVEDEPESAVPSSMAAFPINTSGFTQRMDDNASDSDDGDNEFSDSVEDQSELQTAPGFASLDAILESPATEAKEQEAGLGSVGAMQNTGTAHPLDDYIPTATAVTTDEPVPAPSATAPAEDWNMTRAYWSSLNEQQKQALEASHKPEPVVANEEPTPIREKPTTKSRAGAPTSAHREAKPQKSALKQNKPPADKSSSEPTHFRNSMRGSGSMMKSMRGPPPERSPSRGNQQNRPRRTSEPKASADAIALAQATAKAMAAKEAEERKARDASQEDTQRGRKAGTERYSMSRSMREGRAARPAPAAETSGGTRTSMRGSVLQSADTSESKSGGFLGFGKAKQKPAKPKGPSARPTRRFASRFGDSSDEDSDGGGRGGFRSRFADSDDSDDDAPARPMKIQLAPVRGIPKSSAKDDGDSTDLDESEDERPQEPAQPLPRSSKDRPGTPPTAAVLNFGKSPGPAGIDVSKPAPAPTSPKQEPPTSPRSPASPKSPRPNGDTAEGKMLSAGTLRDEPTKDKSNRHSFLSFGRKPKQEDAQKSTLADSKWATTPGSPSSRPQTPSRGFAKTLRDKPPGQEKEKRASMLRRLSIGSRDSSMPGTPTGGRANKDDFPFPPPPIPEEYRSPTDGERPNTSDGVSPKATNVDDSMRTARPPIGQKRDSAMTAPESGGRNKLSKNRDPVFSSKTGKKKKFQGLRRVFRLDD